MVYEVTYQVDGEERTDVIDAPDAAGAAASVRDAHARGSDRFELLLVHLVEDDSRTAPPAVFDGNATSAGI